VRVAQLDCRSGNASQPPHRPHTAPRPLLAPYLTGLTSMADHTGCVEKTCSGSVCTTNAVTDSRMAAMMKVAMARDRRVDVGSSNVVHMRSRRVLGLAPPDPPTQTQRGRVKEDGEEGEDGGYGADTHFVAGGPRRCPPCPAQRWVSHCKGVARERGLVGGGGCFELRAAHSHVPFGTGCATSAVAHGRDGPHTYLPLQGPQALLVRYALVQLGECARHVVLQRHKLAPHVTQRIPARQRVCIERCDVNAPRPAGTWL